MQRFGVLLAGLSALVPSPGLAQGDCFPGASSNEARTMATFAVPLAFSAASAPAQGSSGRLRVGLELSYLPNVDPAMATPTICRPGKGPENTDLLFATPRPRVDVTLPLGFAVEASWIPPIRLSQVEANLVGVALSRVMRLDRRGAVLRLRAHATVGVIKAPITCSDEALQDASSACYQGSRSNDSFQPNILGVEAAVGWSLGAALRPYVGAGYNHLAPRFQVNFTDRFGVVDRRRVSVDLHRAVLFAGATWSDAGRLSLTGEIYAAPEDAITARVAARFLVRRSSRPVSDPAPLANSAPTPGASPGR